MKPVNKTIFNSVRTFAVASLLTLSSNAFSATLSSVIDDFNNAENNNLGIARVLITDTTAGGKTTTELDVANGVMQIKGEIVPPRGQPGWSSLVLPLGAMNEPQDASKFDGIRLLVKVNSGNISISANSSEITNYDYHTAQVVVTSDGKFHEVKIPFESMKRIWSEQTKLNTQMLNSLSIVAFSPQKSTFEFAVDEVSFY
ncbi:MAG: CIA30 family protein [Colwellia sp.]|nr:CIA30 family protein [Colwellia sp.]